MSIIVQVSDRSWTMQALHLACAMARNANLNLLLLQFRRVTNAGLLGTGIGPDVLTEQNERDLEEYEAVAEDYGVPLIIQPMEYESLPEAAVQAVAALGATALFMHLPEHRFSFWRRLRVRYIQRRLNMLDCRLYLCDQPTQPDPWMPAISLPAAKHSSRL